MSDKLQRTPQLWKFARLVYGWRNYSTRKIRYFCVDNSPALFDPTTKNFSLLFDAQCLQTATRERGIGKYSLSFIAAICLARPNEEFGAYLTAISSEDSLKIAQDSLKELSVPNLEIFTINLMENKGHLKIEDAQEILRNTLEKVNCRIVLSLSSFENAESAIPLPASSKYKRVSILYDLIPIAFSKELLTSRKQKGAYLWALRNLMSYDLLLSISKETKRSWLDLVSSDMKIEVILGGGHHLETVVQKSFLQRKGILCVGAEQHHKNIERLIEAYSLLPRGIQLEHPLTIVGIRSSGSRRRLLKIGSDSQGNISIPPYLDTESLRQLYRNSRLHVMPSLMEGLSLPILEAWSNNLVSIGSAGTVAQEIIGISWLLFDPLDSGDIATLMNRLLVDAELWNEALDRSKRRSQKFSWAETAKLASIAIKELEND
jgi:glycosyltransferase involved in cell wall biosynthesis